MWDVGRWARRVVHLHPKRTATTSAAQRRSGRRPASRSPRCPVPPRGTGLAPPRIAQRSNAQLRRQRSNNVCGRAAAPCASKAAIDPRPRPARDGVAARPAPAPTGTRPAGRPRPPPPRSRSAGRCPCRMCSRASRSPVKATALAPHTPAPTAAARARANHPPDCSKQLTPRLPNQLWYKAPHKTTSAGSA